MGVMAPGGQGAGPGPGMPGVWGHLRGWRRRGCRRPLRRGRTPRSHRSATRRPHRAGPARFPRGAPPRPGPRTGACCSAGRERDFAQEPLPQAFQRQRVGAASPAPVQRIGGQVEEDLAGEGVVAGMQRLELAQQLEYPGVAGQPVEQDPPGGGGVLGRGPCASHTQTVGQNRSARLDLRQRRKWSDRW